MKKLSVKKGSECMACLQCVQACSEAFYKENDVTKSCIQIVERKGAAKPMVCTQCGLCAKACPNGAITQNPKTGVYISTRSSALPAASVPRPAPSVWSSRTRTPPLPSSIWRFLIVALLT